MIWLMLFNEMLFFYCKDHTKQMNLLWVQNTEILFYNKRYILLPLSVKHFEGFIT